MHFISTYLHTAKSVSSTHTCFFDNIPNLTRYNIAKAELRSYRMILFDKQFQLTKLIAYS